MEERLQILKGFSQSLFGKITVKSVQNSHIWLIGVFLLFIITAAVFKIETWITICLVLLLFVLVGYYLYRDHYFMKKHPEYLRSETFQLEKQHMEMLGEKNNEISESVADALPAVTAHNTSLTAKPELIVVKTRREN